MLKVKVRYAGWIEATDASWPASYPTFARPPYLIDRSVTVMDRSGFLHKSP